MNKKYTKPVVLGILVFIIGVYVSSITNAYYFFPHIDKVYHFMGGFALGWFFYVYLSFEKMPLSKIKQFLFIVSMTCLVAVFWEYAERLSTLYSPTYAPWILHWFQGGDLNDTLLDIFTGMCGAVGFWILNSFSEKPKLD